LEVQEAPDAEAAVSPEELAALAPERWEEARFAFAPALRLLRATHDVAPAVIDAAEGRDPERPAVGAGAYRLYPAGEGGRPARRAAVGADLLEALLAGRGLEEACAAVQRARGGETADLAAAGARLLVHAAAHGLLTRVEAPGAAARGAGAT